MPFVFEVVKSIRFYLEFDLIFLFVLVNFSLAFWYYRFPYRLVGI
jgi:hypothetical protein